ncbi:MAG TPA: mycofactocin-associated electron transfer flavoprotein alpha subunit [Acidimicrobiales bacterium]|nr:mycofactocin-associated electron transfer flavoprotein alpha subunit [Acidimicrobiales bacterium]
MSAALSAVTVVVTVRDGELAVGASDALGMALEMTAAVTAVRAVLIGRELATAAESLAEGGFADVMMLFAEAEAFAPGAWARELAAAPVVVDADVVLLPGSADGRDLAPRLAAQLQRPFLAGTLALDGHRAVLPRASGRAQAEARVDLPVVATCQTGVGAAPRDEAGETVSPALLDGFALATDATVLDARVLGVAEADAATMDLSEAPFILGVGAGLGTPEAVDALGEVAEELDASVGATRVVTDEGWVSHDRQIGTTGVVVDPRTYVAFGISGAVQHTSGLGAPDHVISVNTDPHCPMMQLSDLAIVADAPAVVEELRRRLDEAVAIDEAVGHDGSDPRNEEAV